MTCPHEQLRGRCYHPSLVPWPGNCLDDDACPGGLGPWGAWRSCADMLTAIYTGLEESGAMDDRIIVFSWGEYATNYDLFRNIACDELEAVGWKP